MTLEHALALFATMPLAEQAAILRIAVAGQIIVNAMRDRCQCEQCRNEQRRFIAAVSARADEIERVMLAGQKTEGRA